MTIDIAIIAVLFVFNYIVSLVREALLEISRERIEEFEAAFKKASSIRRLRKLMKRPSESVAAIVLLRLGLLAILFIKSYTVARNIAGIQERVVFLVLLGFGAAIFVEFIPQVLGFRRNLRIVKNYLFFIEIVAYSLLPLVKFLKFIANIILRLAGVKGFKSLNYIDEDEVELLLEEDAERFKEIEEMEKDMISGIIAFRESVVREVMVPRINMVSISSDTTIEEALKVFLESGHSRIPVYKERIDNIIGVLYAKDILGIIKDSRSKKESVTKIMRKPIFVPETKRLNELLLEFKKKKAHMAIVVDEYGGTSGLVTIEDILEEIVGEIEDEFDKTGKKKYKRLRGGVIETDAQVDIDELNEEFDLDLPTDETYESVAGLIIEHLGYVPKIGEKVEIDGYMFEIMDADEKHIKRVRFHKTVSHHKEED